MIEDVEANERFEILSGKVAYHGKDKEKLHRKAMKSVSKHIMTFYIGEPDPKMEFWLSSWA